MIKFVSDLRLISGFLLTPPPISSINKTDCHYITEILWKMVLNTITPNWFHMNWIRMSKTRVCRPVDSIIKQTCPPVDSIIKQTCYNWYQMFNTRIITKYLQKMYIDKSFNQLKTIRQYQVNYLLEQFFSYFFLV